MKCTQKNKQNQLYSAFNINFSPGYKLLKVGAFYFTEITRISAICYSVHLFVFLNFWMIYHETILYSGIEIFSNQ